MTCLTYTSPGAEDARPLEAAVPVVIALSGKLEVRNTQEYVQRHVRVMEKGILPAFVYGGDNLEIRRALIDGARLVAGQIGVETVRYFKVRFVCISILVRH